MCLKSNQIMTLADLQEISAKLTKEIGGDFEIWLSSDEEGNEYLPLLKNIEFSLAIDKEAERIVLFPSHR